MMMIEQVMRDLEANKEERARLNKCLADTINDLIENLPPIYSEDDDDYALGRVYYDSDSDKLLYERESVY